ncbi:MAG: TraR/DksA family transcriptional regulator [Candidatus Dormibacteria bacterium]
MMDSGGLGGGLDSTTLMLQTRLHLLNSSLQDAEQREANVEEAQRLRHQRHVATLHHLVSQVEAALGKVREGSYGKCDACGQEIPTSDLSHEPASTLCNACRGHQG